MYSYQTDPVLAVLILLGTLILALAPLVMLIITYYRIQAIRNATQETNRHLKAIHDTLKNPNPKASHTIPPNTPGFE